ncbi:MAG: M3 family metallopeptidase [Prevotellaceae bacterium]|jgi:peptidyl-dipeptidase Dcp|nr:M3 family metallopeptidase [Prevotellaceae bacterium]
MKATLLMALLMAGILTSCTDSNPFFTEWQTPYGVPPFDRIQNKHFLPAYKEALKQQQADIDRIAENPEPPTFENTIVAMDNAGALLAKVSGVFMNLVESDSDPERQAIEEEISPELSKSSDDIYLNARLFSRVKAVFEQKDALNLDTESAALLEKTYKAFIRSGANLNGEDQAKLRKINEELAVLSVKYGQNVLADNNAFRIIIDHPADLSGLPAAVVQAAAERATAEGHDGKWVFTLDAASRIPFLQYADNRELRRQMLDGYAHKGNNNNANDNKETVQKIASLEYQKAVLLGFPDYASFVLENRMAKTPETVNAFLQKLWEPTQKVTERELGELQKIAAASGQTDRIEPWDWWYYTEKLRKARYDFDDEAVRPYFQLENVRAGAFMVANKLYGISFEELKGVPVYHPEVTAYLVKDADGSDLGVFYTDYFPRASKRAGAWMNNIREQHGVIRPIIINVCNFTKPTAEAPSLLTIDEVETLFHELGHAIHGFLSQCKYIATSGTNVLRDFVELLSQINENWALHPEVLKLYAKHYQTGEVIPDSLIRKIQATAKFNQGFTTTELLAAAILDMNWYTLRTADFQDVEQFEKNAMDKIGLTYAIIPRYRSTYFTHVFGGGYAAGYYGYLWAEQLDADAFQAFLDAGNVFDPATAQSFRKNILERGGSEDPMTLYKAFRGKEPDGDALLQRRGLK